eukprot:jgi/Mesvir1/15991/Mv08296-RA.1
MTRSKKVRRGVKVVSLETPGSHVREGEPRGLSSDDESVRGVAGALNSVGKDVAVQDEQTCAQSGSGDAGRPVAMEDLPLDLVAEILLHLPVSDLVVAESVPFFRECITPLWKQMLQAVLGPHLCRESCGPEQELREELSYDPSPTPPGTHPSSRYQLPPQPTHIGRTSLTVLTPSRLRDAFLARYECGALPSVSYSGSCRTVVACSVGAPPAPSNPTLASYSSNGPPTTGSSSHGSCTTGASTIGNGATSSVTEGSASASPGCGGEPSGASTPGTSPATSTTPAGGRYLRVFPLGHVCPSAQAEGQDGRLPDRMSETPRDVYRSINDALADARQRRLNVFWVLDMLRHRCNARVPGLYLETRVLRLPVGVELRGDAPLGQVVITDTYGPGGPHSVSYSDRSGAAAAYHFPFAPAAINVHHRRLLREEEVGHWRDAGGAFSPRAHSNAMITLMSEGPVTQPRATRSAGQPSRQRLLRHPGSIDPEPSRLVNLVLRCGGKGSVSVLVDAGRRLVVDGVDVECGPQSNAAIQVGTFSKLVLFASRLRVADDSSGVVLCSGMTLLPYATIHAVGCHLSGFCTGVRSRFATATEARVTLERCRITGCVIKGLEIDGKDVEACLTQCLFARCDSAVSVNYGARLRVSHCVVADCSSDGLYAFGRHSSMTIDGCVVRGCQYGINAYSGACVSITDSRIDDSQNDGILAYGEDTLMLLKDSVIRGTGGGMTSMLGASVQLQRCRVMGRFMAVRGASISVVDSCGTNTYLQEGLGDATTWVSPANAVRPAVASILNNTVEEST